MYRRYPIVALIVGALFALSDAAKASQPAAERDSTTQITATGRVVDSQGRPVEGASLTLYQRAYTEKASSPKTGILQESRAGRAGAFSLTAPQQGNPYVPRFIVAQKAGLAVGWATWRTRTDQRFDIVLGEPKDLVGDVVDEDGQPIADAEVGIALAVMGKGEDRRILALPSFLDIRTDEKGHFRFAGVPAEATFEFVARKSGRVTLNTLTQVAFGNSPSVLNLTQIASGQRDGQYSPGQTGIRLILPPAAVVEGVVVDKTSGKPVGGVKVTAGMDQVMDGFLPPDPVMTAEDGTFRIDGLAAGKRTVQSAIPREQVAEWVAEPVQVNLRPGETNSGVRLELTKGGIIEVLVKGSGGKPVAQASVDVRPVQGNQYFRGTTDENGLARIRVPSGRYRVSEPFRLGYGRHIREEQVAIGEGETRRVEFILDSVPTIEGTVRDEAGNPLAGVKVAVMPVAPLEVAIDVNGKFTVSLPLQLRHPSVIPYVLIGRDVARNLVEVIEVGEQTKGIELTLKAGTIFTGTVVNHQRKAVAGADIRVLLERPNGGVPFSIVRAMTGEDGKFEINAIPRGRQYTLTATANGYDMQQVSVQASNRKSSRQDVGVLRLALADLSISGIVVDSLGKPVVGATVSLAGRSRFPGSTVKTGADGRFVLTGVPAGLTTVRASVRRSTWLLGSTNAKGGASDVRIVLSE